MTVPVISAEANVRPLEYEWFGGTDDEPLSSFGDRTAGDEDNKKTHPNDVTRQVDGTGRPH